MKVSENIKLPNEQKGIIYAFSSGLCYGLTGFLGISLVHSGLSIFNMLFWRFSISSILLVIVLMTRYNFSNQPHRRTGGHWILLYGLIFYGTSSMAYFASSAAIGTGVATVVLFTYPAMVVLLNFIFDKKTIHPLYYISIFIVILGVILLSDFQDFTFNIMGLSLGLLSALLYSFYIVSTRHIVASPLFSTLMVSIGCSILCFAASYFNGSFYVPSTIYEWKYLILMAIFCTLLPILLLLKALEYISPMKASILSVFEPVFVVILGVLLLGEQVTNLQLIGMMTILSGASLVLFL